MDDGKAEFALRQVLAEPLVRSVGCVGDVVIVVEDLEEEADGVD